MFLFMTNFQVAARLLLGMRFKSIGGSGNTWIRQPNQNIVDSTVIETKYQHPQSSWEPALILVTSENWIVDI